jgi:glycosyltransferase involved in cell wall biosynthesis
MKEDETKKPHIAILMMLKNEENRIHISLQSIIGVCDSLVIYDTGSTDKTLSILKKFSEENNIPLRLKEGEFVDFSSSRNVSLDFADSFEDIDFILLMDCNDELKGATDLIEFCKKELDSKNNVYHIQQCWTSGGSSHTYVNTRLIKPRCGIKYKGAIHEYIHNPTQKRRCTVGSPNTIELYQNRDLDNNKSGPRYARDKEILLVEYKKDNTDTRTLFYLAQTCSCLGQDEDAFFYYKLRSELDGFLEEKFHALLRCGKLSIKLNNKWNTSFGFFMKSFEVYSRVEPLVCIINYYISINKIKLSYPFIKLACSLNYPKKALLFVQDYDYNYTRWHKLGHVSYYCKQYQDGKLGCEKAIEHSNREIDKNNLKFYIDK